MSTRRGRNAGSRRGVRGVALLSVIMIMLVLSVLAAYLAESLSGRSAQTTLAALTRQAEQAAAGGLEWGKRRALATGVCAPAEIRIGTMTVDVGCAAESIDEDGTLYPVYEITAEAHRGSYGDTDHVRRSVRARYAAR